jgi:hypothetical protein
MALARELAWFFAPYVNSYKRYQEGTFAPTRIAWGVDNRTTGFRVCGDGQSLRIENRIPGADANPYLAYAATIAAGLHGIEKRLEPPPLYVGNAYEDAALPRVPSTLRDAIAALEGSAFAAASSASGLRALPAHRAAGARGHRIAWSRTGSSSAGSSASRGGGRCGSRERSRSSRARGWGRDARRRCCSRARGARVVVCDVNERAAADTARAIGRKGGKALAVVGDVGRESDVERMVDEGVRKFPCPARAVQQRRRPLEGPGPLGARDVVRELGPGAGDQPEGPVLRDQARHPAPDPRGRRLDHQHRLGVALAGFTRRAGRLHVREGALIALTRSLAIQFARKNVRCNIIHPGIIETPMQAPYLKDKPSGARSRSPSRSGASRTRGRSPRWRCSSPPTSRRT